MRLFRSLLSFGLSVVLSLLFDSLQSILTLEIHFSVMISRQNFNQTGQFLFYFRYSTVIQFLWPISLIFPIRIWVKFAQTIWLYITITSKTIESFPIFPTRLVNKMVWI